MQAFLIRWFITTLAVMAVAWLVPTVIHYDTMGALLGASLLLGIINAMVRPVLLLLSLPFIIVTMGLFIFVVNALLLWFVAAVVPQFHVSGFWGAFFGAILISIVSWALSSIFRSSDGRVHLITHHESPHRTAKRANARTIE